jgi:hypothetical protein
MDVDAPAEAEADRPGLGRCRSRRMKLVRRRADEARRFRSVALNRSCRLPTIPSGAVVVGVRIC